MNAQNQNILIIDDNPEFSQSLKLLIVEVTNQPNSSVECVNSIPDAISNLRNKEFQFVFINSDLPNRDGLTAIRLIKIARPEIKIIACSFHKEMFYQFQVENAGALTYLVKDEIDNNSIKNIFGISESFLSNVQIKNI